MKEYGLCFEVFGYATCQAKWMPTNDSTQAYKQVHKKSEDKSKKEFTQREVMNFQIVFPGV